MSQALNLFQLQKIDTRRDQVHNRLSEIEKALLSNPELFAAQAAFTEADQHTSQVRRVLKAAEEAVQAQQIRIEQEEASLYSGRIRNPKELQDLQNEIAALKRYLRTLEDNQLEAMLIQEQAEKDLAQAASLLKIAEGKSVSMFATLHGEQDLLLKELRRLDTERTAATASIPPNQLAIYERLRLQRRGVAVAGVEDSSCLACGSSLTQAEWQAARAPGRLGLCPSCGRILYAG